MQEESRVDDRWIAERKIGFAERAHDRERELGVEANKAAVSSGAQALRAMLLINGGAAVAVLAFIGGYTSAPNSTQLIAPFAGSLLWFAWGVATAAAATGFGYMTNLSNAADSLERTFHYEPGYVQETDLSRKKNRAAKFYGKCAVFGAILSLLFFLFGIYAVQDAVVGIDANRGVPVLEVTHSQ